MIAALLISMINGSIPESLLEISSDKVFSSFCGHTLLIKPMRWASIAFIRSPNMIISFALDSPINLLILDRPAVLHMKNEQGQGFFAALTGVQGTLATLEINGERMQTDFAELSKRWSGSFVLIWQPPIGYKGSIRRGHKGQVVSWLSERLAKIKGAGFTGKKSNKVYFQFGFYL